MNTARIYKEEFENPAIWDTVVRELELPEDTDEITVKAVSSVSESQRQKARKKGKKKTTLKKDDPAPSIQIIIAGGAVQSVTKPKGLTLEIRDYDVNDVDAEGHSGCKKDRDGDWYQKMFWDEDERD